MAHQGNTRGLTKRKEFCVNPAAISKKMISTPTVFILGAGASGEYEFPVGMRFRNQICNLQNSTDYYTDMRELGLNDLAVTSISRAVNIPSDADRPNASAASNFASAAEMLGCNFS